MSRVASGRQWLPSIAVYGSTTCSDAWEAEGIEVIARWGPFVLVQFFGRIERAFDDIAQSEDDHEIAK